MERALALLAMSGAKQAQYLIELGTYPLLDELALEYSDTYLVFKDRVEFGRIKGISSNVITGLEEIDLSLNELSDQKDSFSWYEECLADPRWESIRWKAAIILEALRHDKSSLSPT